MRAAWAAGLVVAAACGGAPRGAAPAQVTRHAARDERAERARVVGDRPLIPRPPLPLAAVVPLLDPPWPLTAPPSLEPHLAVGQVADSCSEGWKKRHAGDSDVLAYGLSWCRIRGGDRDAVHDLALVGRTARPQVADAVVLDVVNQLADQDVARDALEQLEALGMTGVATLDLLAGTYAALGRSDDAAEVGARALADAGAMTSGTPCERLLAFGQLDATTTAPLQQLAPSCSARGRAALCVATTTDHGIRACYAGLPPDPDLAARVTLVEQWRFWDAEPSNLLTAARTLDPLLRLPGAEQLAVTALEDALLSSRCEDWVVAGVRDEAHKMLVADRHAPRFDARLHSLVAMTPASCVDFAPR